MSVSIFDLFKIGIGPSSSHTVGPMRAAKLFTERLSREGLLKQTHRVWIELFGSLGHTGRGHGSDRAVMLGLKGREPDSIDPDEIPTIIERITAHKMLELHGGREIDFDPKKDLIFHKRDKLPHHSNGMRFHALDDNGQEIAAWDYYSVGGGFVVDRDEAGKDRIVADRTPQPYPFKTGDELLAQARDNDLSIAEIMMRNEEVWRTREQIEERLDEIWKAMRDCIERGVQTTGELPGGLHVARRAPRMYQRLREEPEAGLCDPLTVMDWVNLYALAVNEENAAGGRVVTAPTNGAAGILPAVGRYYERFHARASAEGIRHFLLTAAAIGILYKENASISGAEVGCQGEVGVACSMAAGGLTAALGGSIEQIENAAEIGMEHNLGLTCDPIGGLVQIPCIERNAMGAVKAINATRMALAGEGKHRVSLDKVIKTMRDTGADMKTKYKETSRGGLAVNVIEC